MLAVGAQRPGSAEVGEYASPMLGSWLHVEPHPPPGKEQGDIAAVLMAGERIPLRIPAAYCEELFANCASESTSNLLRSVYFRETPVGDSDYVLDQGLVTPGELTERSSRIQLALRTAALAVWQKHHQQRAHRAAPPVPAEDPATKRRLVQQEHVITLQNRKIQELEARAARIKDVGHSFIESPATAIELQEAQARLSVLKVHTDQQAADIKKLESEVEAAVQQLQQQQEQGGAPARGLPQFEMHAEEIRRDWAERDATACDRIVRDEWGGQVRIAWGSFMWRQGRTAHFRPRRRCVGRWRQSRRTETHSFDLPAVMCVQAQKSTSRSSPCGTAAS